MIVDRRGRHSIWGHTNTRRSLGTHATPEGHTAREQGAPYHVGNIFSADLFYTVDEAMLDTMEKYNILGLEMEAAGMYALAAEHGVDALAICTVSDDIRSGAALTSEERASTFDDMIKVALQTVLVSVQ